MNFSCALQSVSEATHAFERFLKCKLIAPPFEIVNLMVKIAVYAWTRWFMLEPGIKNTLFMDERKETWTWHWKLKWAQKLSYNNEHQQDKEKKEDVTLWLCQSTLVAISGLISEHDKVQLSFCVVCTECWLAATVFTFSKSIASNLSLESRYRVPYALPKPHPSPNPTPQPPPSINITNDSNQPWQLWNFYNMTYLIHLLAYHRRRIKSSEERSKLKLTLKGVVGWECKGGFWHGDSLPTPRPKVCSGAPANIAAVQSLSSTSTLDV